MTFETESGTQLDESKATVGSARPYQIANAIAFFLNVIFVAIPGRLDLKFGREDWPGNGVVAYATPALYAFAIWGAIYITELVFTIWQFLQNEGTGPQKRINMIVAMTPGWCAGHGFQVLWCLAFRPYVLGFSTFWIPAALLTASALALGFAHRAAAAAAEGIEELVVMAPISMHCGWVTAAALLNWNQWITMGYTALTPRLAALGASLAVAVIAGVGVSVSRGAPGYVCTVAWAVIALGVQASSSTIMAAELGADNLRILATTELVVGSALAVFGLGMKAKLVFGPGGS